MSLIDDIKRDREAGTPGPWHLHDCKDWDGRATYHYQEVWTEDCDVIAAEVYRAHNDGGSANMSRIARIPEMEAALLAAEELAEAVEGEDQMMCQDWNLQNQVVERKQAALAAFKKALKQEGEA